MSPRRAAAWGLLAAILFASSWSVLHPAQPLSPTDDLYTHLSVARHLVRGDGFLTDVTYPLSFAYSFAARLPQPLVHRPPGYAMLLTLPHVAAGGDPALTVVAVRVMQILVIGLLAWLGTSAWLRRARPAAAMGWLVVLGANPLLTFAANWGHSEIVTALLLFAHWLRGRQAGPPTAGDGLLLGSIALIRPELAGIPVFWWLRRCWGRFAAEPQARRSLLAALLVFLVVTTPWSVRNARLTGDPFFSLQAQAEHLKDTRDLPGYTVYRQLEPHPLVPSLAADPIPVLRKVYRGLRFYVENISGLLPWPFLLVSGICLAAGIYRGSRRAYRRWRPVADAELTAPPDESHLVSCREPGLAGVTIVLLAVLYAPFDHSLRHLLVMAPIVMWESMPFFAETPWRYLRRRWGRIRPNNPTVIIVTVAVAWGIVRLTTVSPVGWIATAHDAVRREEAVRRETAALRTAPPGPTFVTTSAAPWFADRPAVWMPADAEVRARITTILGTGQPVEAEP